MSAIAVKSSINPKFHIIKLERKFDTVAAENVEQLLNELIANKETDIIIDFKESNYLSSMGLRVLFSISRAINEENKKLILINAGPTVMKVIRIADCETLFDIYLDETEAIKAKE